MKRYKQITEKRRNPELNPHVGAWDRLEELKDDPDVYISFTNIDKIGINPQSRFNTPVGVYTYPLREFITKYVNNARMNSQFGDKKINSVGSYAPYAGGGTYVNFIRLKDKSNFINDMYTDYGSDKFDKDMGILKKKYGKDDVSDYQIMKFTNDLIDILATKGVLKTEDDVLKLIKKIDKQKIFTRFPKEYQFRVLKDSLSFFRDHKLSKLKERLGTYLYEVVSLGIGSLIKQGIETAKAKNPVTSMWNVTRLLAQELSKSDKQASTKWNMILSKDLGYSGFADKSSRGIIHNAEPMQAVFLRTSAFELLYRELNKPAKKQFDLSTEEGQIEFVKHNVDNIKYIKNPSEAMQIEAIRRSTYSSLTRIIKYIKDPSEKVQLEMIKIEVGSIQYIKNPTEKVIIEALHSDKPILIMNILSDKGIKISDKVKKVYSDILRNTESTYKRRFK